MAANGLEANLGLLTPEQAALCEALNAAGQAHLFADWPAPGEADEDKQRLAAQLVELDGQYAKGLLVYIANAKKLLADKQAGVTAFEGYKVEVPEGARLTPFTDDFAEAEAAGLAAAGEIGFVLVAGGLGERLGYNGIKIELPSETTTMTSFLGMYVLNILALQERARAASGSDDIVLPLCIMTSGDTDAKTRALLEANDNFGMADGQLTIVKQEKVPALANWDADFAVDPSDPYKVLTKPHGHGDVHFLVKDTIAGWHERGLKWVLFFQDTNGLVFKSLPALLGVSVQNQFEVNTLSVPRQPGEAVGCISRLVPTSDAVQELTLNVEYSEIDALLKSIPETSEGDVADPATGYSMFPGNTNVLVFALPEYHEVLQRTDGAVPEFVNPKDFSKPTRLECMMQEYPRLLPPTSRVGFTELPRWICFSAVKNNVAAARKKQASGIAPECASSGEADMYKSNRYILNSIGVNVEVEGPPETFDGVEVEGGARVVLMPNFGVTVAEVAAHFPNPGAVSISPRSTLIVNGTDITIESLTLDGTLVIEGEGITVSGKEVTNEGWRMREVPNEAIMIRGFTIEKDGEERITA